jgi:hypothetical protein
MTPARELPSLIEGFFAKRLVAQRAVSAHTIASYRDTFPSTTIGNRHRIAS